MRAILPIAYAAYSRFPRASHTNLSWCANIHNGIMPDVDLARVTSRLGASIDVELGNAKPTILILGPSIRGRRLSQAAKLRKEILHRAKESGVGVKGELTQLIKEAQKRFTKPISLCTVELEIAVISDAIVLVPASPGSFAEFGMFALAQGLTCPILVLLDRKHKNKRSYLRHGPTKAMSDGGAVIRWVNYARTKTVLDLVMKHIDLAKERVLTRQRFGRG